MLMQLMQQWRLSPPPKPDFNGPGSRPGHNRRNEMIESDIFPVWAVEFPHRGDPVAFFIPSLDEMEKLVKNTPSIPDGGQRSDLERYEDARFSLGDDLSHMKIIPEIVLEEIVEDPTEWEGRWGQCGGPAGRAALRAATGIY